MYSLLQFFLYSSSRLLANKFKGKQLSDITDITDAENTEPIEGEKKSPERKNSASSSGICQFHFNWIIYLFAANLRIIDFIQLPLFHSY